MILGDKWVKKAKEMSSKFFVFHKAPLESLKWKLEHCKKRVELYEADIDYHEGHLDFLHSRLKEELVEISKLEEFFNEGK